MSKIEYIDIAEFCDEGFLQEANRIFFHPHGLALVVNVIGPDGWKEETLSKEVQAIADILEKQFGHGFHKSICEETAIDIMNELHPPNSEYIGGVWDDRDDPEGVWFDFRSWGTANDSWGKYSRVLAERAKHTGHRINLFSDAYGRPTGDIEPILNPEDDGSQGQQKGTIG